MSKIIRDLTGQRFGRLIALEPTDQRMDKKVVWRCMCDCGNEAMICGQRMTSGNTKSCGCLQKEILSRRMSIDLVGRRFGRLIVERKWEQRKSGRVAWVCQCDCGEESIVQTSSLTSGNTTSCGCYHSEVARGLLLGMSGPDHYTWNHTLTQEEREQKRQFPEYREWRLDVLKRDSFACVICGSKKRIVAHHLESYAANPDLRYKVRNGKTLCWACHQEFHDEFGIRNSTEVKFLQFIKSKAA